MKPNKVNNIGGTMTTTKFVCTHCGFERVIQTDMDKQFQHTRCPMCKEIEFKRVKSNEVKQTN